MEVLNMVPFSQMMNIFVGMTLRIMGYILLGVGLYYMGKGLWLTIRGRP